MAENLYFERNADLPIGVYVASQRPGETNNAPVDGFPCLFLVRNEVSSDADQKLSLKDVWKEDAPDFCFAFVPRFPAASLKSFSSELRTLVFANSHSSTKRIPLIGWIHESSSGENKKPTGGEFLYFDEWKDDRTIDLKGLPFSKLLSIPLEIGGFKLSIGFESKVTLENFELKFSNAVLDAIDVIGSLAKDTPTIEKELFRCDLVSRTGKSSGSEDINRIGFITAQINAINLDLLPIGFSYYSGTQNAKPTQRFDYRIFEKFTLNVGVFVHPGDLWISELGFIHEPEKILALPTYFRTTSNEPVKLRPHSSSRLVLNRVYKPKGQDGVLFDFPLIDEIPFQFLPVGKFFVCNSSIKDLKLVRIVCGLTGTEYMSMYSPVTKNNSSKEN